MASVTGSRLSLLLIPLLWSATSSFSAPRSTTPGSATVLVNGRSAPFAPTVPHLGRPATSPLRRRDARLALRSSASGDASRGRTSSSSSTNGLFGRRRRRFVDGAAVASLRSLVRGVVARARALALAASLLVVGLGAGPRPPAHAGAFFGRRADVDVGRAIDDYATRRMFSDAASRFDAFEDAYREAALDAATDAPDPAREILREEGVLAATDASVGTDGDAVDGSDGEDDGPLSRFTAEFARSSARVVDAVTRYAETTLGMDPQTVRFLTIIFNIVALPIGGIYTILAVSGGVRKRITRKQAKTYREKQDLSATEKEPGEDDDNDNDDDEGGDGDDDGEGE